MSKPRCHFYPNEAARRQCPAIQAPISSRACTEKYLSELKCPHECPYLMEVMGRDVERLLRRAMPRILIEFPHNTPGWLKEDNSILLDVFLQTEKFIARFGQWYSEILDKDILLVIDDIEAQLRSRIAKIEVRPNYTSGWQNELASQLEGRLGFDDIERLSPEQIVIMRETCLEAFGIVRTSAAHFANETGRGYINLLIQYADQPPPKPASSRLILPT